MLLVLGPSCILLLIAQPRALIGGALPVLELDEAAVAQVIVADRARAAPIPLLPAEIEIEALYALDVIGQLEIDEAVESFEKRRRELKARLIAIASSAGPDATLALRARALRRVEQALAGELPESEIEGVMGAFANQLRRHRVLREGRIVAPHFVVRTFYKARWNNVHGLSMDDGLLPIERRALHGWLGLNGRELSANARLKALKIYADLGGPNALQAQGILLVQSGDFHLATTTLSAVQKLGGGLRVANYLLGARVSAGLSGDDL